jgi:predicted dehydrogenase
MKEKIGIGIIGTGFARNVQMPAFAACEGAEIVSVASGSAENARAAADEFGVGHHTANWCETVAHPGVDLVCITTPPVLHREMVLFSLEQGKHVLAEKPVAMNVAEAEEMVAAADGRGVLALIDHELRFQPGRLTARAMVREGAIGRVRHARYMFQAPHRGDPDLPWNWWSDIEQGGGALGAINSHIIDSFHYFLDTDVASVFCQLHTQIKERRHPSGEMWAVTSDDQANMIVRFADGELTDDATGLVSVSMTEGPGYINRIELFGSEGSIRIEHRGELFTAKRGDADWTERDVELTPAIDGVPDTGFSRGFNAFAPKIVEAIREGRTSIEHAATFADGVRVQRILDAARESSENGTRTLLSASH